MNECHCLKARNISLVTISHLCLLIFFSMRTRLGVTFIGLSSLLLRFALFCLLEWKSSLMGVALGSCLARFLVLLSTLCVCVCVFFFFWFESGGNILAFVLIIVCWYSLRGLQWLLRRMTNLRVSDFVIGLWLSVITRQIGMIYGCYSIWIRNYLLISVEFMIEFCW